jgi:hypothetical protein
LQIKSPWNIMKQMVNSYQFNWLLVQCAHLEKWWSSSMGRMNYPISEMENKSHVWNHQPVISVISWESSS